MGVHLGITVLTFLLCLVILFPIVLVIFLVTLVCEDLIMASMIVFLVICPVIGNHSGGLHENNN